ncbi:MAG: ATP-binding protein [Bacteroidota bacterium]
MLLACAWWSVLLFTKNRDAFAAKRDKLRILMIADGAVNDDQAFFQSAPYIDLEKHYKQQEWMIMGEALVFIIILVIGIWLINRGYNKEVNSALQRRNFLLSITHELKSPLASIHLVLETLQKRQLKKELVERLTRNGLIETERLNMLVNDLLLSARFETAYQPNMEPLNLADLLATIVERQQYKHPKATISWIYDDSLSPIIKGDQNGLTSVANNLIENAVKYGTENPTIDVHMKAKNGKVLITVADDGIGISDRDKSKIFEKFYRVGNEDTRKTKGTGLGLYIVAEIVKAHKGQITVADNKPRGTVFKIILPAPGVKAAQQASVLAS